MLPGKAYLQDGRWVVLLDKEPNSERVNTLNSGETNGVPVQVDFVDPRKAEPKQRSWLFGVVGVINKWWGETVGWL